MLPKKVVGFQQLLDDWASCSTRSCNMYQYFSGEMVSMYQDLGRAYVFEGSI